MDKYEFNIKVEQIKKLVNKGDYETAMKIADTIDWRRVRSTSLLTMVAQVYERNEEYQDAKDILLLAFERAPIGKGLLFKLTDLALREGSVSEAEAYYREFCDLSSEDPRQNLLRYLILEVKGAPIEQLINSLERYSQEELDEKWLYKLAELYHESGNEEACVRICDKIMLMFGLGKYVDKAMELKLQHAPLTDYQMDLVENREKYEEKLRAVEQTYKTGGKRQDQEDDFDESDDGYEMEERDIAEEPKLEEEPEAEEADGFEELSDENLIVQLHEDEAEKDLAKEMSMLDSHEEEADDFMGETRVLGDIRHIKELCPSDFAEEETAAAPELAEILAEEETVVEDWDVEPEEDEEKNHLMIEAEDAQSGLNFALESLKKIHRELASKNPVAKISGDNLNKKGVFAVSDRLAGKDLIVEHAADLNEETITELSELMEQDNTGMIVVLIDTPKRMEYLHNNHMGLAGKFQYIGCDKAVAAEEEDQQSLFRQRAEQEAESRRRWEADQEAVKRRQAERDIEEARRQEQYENELRQKDVQEDERRLQAEQEIAERRLQAEYEAEMSVKEQAERAADEAVRQVQYEEERHYQNDDSEDAEDSDDGYEEQPEAPERHHREDDDEMDVEEFVKYACKYATEIDCSISGKSMLALYERAEMMEEDGIPLTRMNAEDLLEEAADRAEKHSLGGLFSSKYDKDGLLVLKEKHFFD